MAFVKFQCANEKKEKERGLLYLSRRQKLHSNKELKKKSTESSHKLKKLLNTQYYSSIYTKNRQLRNELNSQPMVFKFDILQLLQLKYGFVL